MMHIQSELALYQSKINEFHKSEIFVEREKLVWLVYVTNSSTKSDRINEQIYELFSPIWQFFVNV